jgi:hypothetical protein
VLVDQGLLAALTADPLAAYPALAALLLASVAIASGLLRGDVLALARPAPVAWILAALAVAWLLQGVSTAQPAAWADTLAAAALAPIAVIAVAYGPTPALVTLALAHAWIGVPPYPSAVVGPVGALLVGLELALLGWLAIAPSPRRYPLLAGLYLVVAHAFTWATAGLAWLVVTHGDLSLAAATDTHGLRFGAVAATALVLALVPPPWWRRAFPGSALAPPPPPQAADRTAATVSPTAAGSPPTPGAAGLLGAAGDEQPDPGRMTSVWDGSDLQPWTRPRPRPRHADGAEAAPAPPQRYARPPRRRGGASRS